MPFVPISPGVSKSGMMREYIRRYRNPERRKDAHPILLDIMPTRKGVIEAINHPLGFFVLALLIVETFLSTVLIGSDLDPIQKYYGMWAGIGLFLLLIIVISKGLL